MALLDDLKKQAQQKTVQDTQDSSKTLQGDEVSWQIIAPKLIMMQNYFKDLVETLNVVEPEDFFQFTLTKGVLFRNLKKRNFQLKSLSQSGGKTFSFRYDLVGELNQKLSVNSEVMIDKIRVLLNEQHMQFNVTSESMSKCTYVIKPHMVTRFRYAANAAERAIDLSIENFDAPGVHNIRLKPGIINPEFMEENAKYILGQPNKFMELAGYTMPDDLRKQLQEKLNQGKQAKAEKAKAEAVKDSVLESTADKLKSIFKR